MPDDEMVAALLYFCRIAEDDRDHQRCRGFGWVTPEVGVKARARCICLCHMEDRE